MKIAIIFSMLFQALIFLCGIILFKNNHDIESFCELMVLLSLIFMIAVNMIVLENYIVIDREVQKYLDKKKSILVNWR